MRDRIYDPYFGVRPQALCEKMRTNQQLPVAIEEYSAYSRAERKLYNAFRIAQSADRHTFCIHAKFHTMESIHTEHRQVTAVLDDLSSESGLGCYRGAVDRSNVQGSACEYTAETTEHVV